MPTNTSQPGYFISFRLWTEAIRLLQFQLDQKQVNRHFNTLSMFYYENLGDSVNILTTEEYYNQRIASGLFYGFRKEFAVYSYPIPKSRLGLREYKFFTYPMRIAYYSYVLYLLLISQGFVQSHYENRPNIRSFYGGDIVFDDEDRLILNRSAVYYREHYKHFRDEVRRECEQDHKNKIVMRLDITSYFDNISMPILLKMLDDCVLPTTKRQHSFDTNTQQQIVQFFQFVSNSQIGIPQSDNDVASSYIGFLYLIFAELIIDDQISEHSEQVNEYGIIRYMDDIFISIEFNPEVPITARTRFVHQLVNQVADALFRDLKLNMNPKTELFWLHKEEDRAKLETTLRKVSPEYPVEDETGNPETKVRSIFSELRKLKSEEPDPLKEYSKTIEEEIFSEVFDTRVDQLLNQAHHRMTLGEIFRDFNFDLVALRPLEMMILILKNSSVATAFRDYLLTIETPTTVETHLLMRYLCQLDFNDQELITKLHTIPALSQIMRVYEDNNLYYGTPGYFELSNAKVIRILQMTFVIEQIQQRVVCELNGDYSKALNHLVNEFQRICWYIDNNRPKKYKNYTSKKLIGFMDRQRIPNSLRRNIDNMFNRRHANSISHSGDEAAPVWGVEESEYFDNYRTTVGECLNRLL